MTEWIEIRAKSVEAAKDEALDRLGVATDEAEFEVLQDAESKLFGLKKTEARVRARVRPRPPRPKAERRPRRSGAGGGGNSGGGGGRNRGRGGKGGGKGQGGRNQGGGGGGRGRNEGGRDNSGRGGNSGGGQDSGNQGGGNQGGGNKAAAAGAVAATGAGAAAAVAGSTDAGNEQPAKERNSGGNRQQRGGNRQEKEQSVTEEVPIEEQHASVRNFLTGILDGFDLTGTVDSKVDEDDIVQAEIHGKDLGLLVGPKGATLHALQELARAAMQRTADGRGTNRLMIDVGGYRARRKEALRGFVAKQAEAVVNDGKRVVLEPMGSADRKTVHDAAAEIDGVSSLSEGDEPRRRVVLVPAEA